MMNAHKIIFILPINLEPGMIIAKSLYIKNLKLLSEGTKLTENTIDKIKYLFPTNPINIYKNIDNYELEIIHSKGSKEYLEVESDFSRFSDSAEVIFNQVMSNSKIQVNSIRNLSEDIHCQMKNTGIVIKNIISERTTDGYLFRHSVNVATLNGMLGKWLNFSSREIMLLTYTGILHDIGKSKMPSNIINKAGPLTTKEFNIMKTHPIKGYDIVKSIPYIDPGIEIGVLMHHERIDGSGYPLGLTGDKVNIYAKITSISDIFDAITSNRPYKQKQNPLKALEIIKEDSFLKLDPEFSTTFVENMIHYYEGELVKLNTGKIAKILKINNNYISKPIVYFDESFLDLSKQNNVFITDLL